MLVHLLNEPVGVICCHAVPVRQVSSLLDFFNRPRCDGDWRVLDES